jgi:hypothetical protein
MSFGLTNPPLTSCTLMNYIYMAELDTFVMVFIEDILANSKNKKEHESHLCIVL